MKRVTGIGGIFFKARDPDHLKQWYEKHLGIAPKPDGGISFDWIEADHPSRPGCTVWAPFPHDTDYFQPSHAPFMINYRVENLEAVLSALRQEGVAVEDKIENYEYGRFGWLMDPEGNRIELWEPPKNH